MTDRPRSHPSASLLLRVALPLALGGSTACTGERPDTGGKTATRPNETPADRFELWNWPPR